MKNLFSLEGKVALIIGGTRGIGKGVAKGLGMAGAKLVISNPIAEESEQAAAELAAETGCEAVGIPCDITDIDDLARLVEEIDKRFGSLDILVNSAGINVRKDSVDVTEKDWDIVQDIQVKGTFFTCQAAARYMLKKGIRGKIINICSIDAKCVSRTNIISYMVAKGGVANMTRALAAEWADKGICVNAIGPGYFQTEMTKVLFEDEATRTELFAHIPQKQFGDPYRDLAGAAVYFASEMSNYTTGQLLLIDGGYTLV